MAEERMVVMMLLLAAWTSFCLGLGCLSAGGRLEPKDDELLTLWTAFGYAFLLWSIGLFVWSGMGWFY